jgi:hypothetical protein
MPVQRTCVFPVISVIHSHYFPKHYERVDVNAGLMLCRPVIRHRRFEGAVASVFKLFQDGSWYF